MFNKKKVKNEEKNDINDKRKLQTHTQIKQMVNHDLELPLVPRFYRGFHFYESNSLVMTCNDGKLNLITQINNISLIT